MSILEAFLAGKEARRVADAQEQINAMQHFVGQNGQAIMAGDHETVAREIDALRVGLQHAVAMVGKLIPDGDVDTIELILDLERLKKLVAGKPP